jgi:hypothetical protein
MYSYLGSSLLPAYLREEKKREGTTEPMKMANPREESAYCLHELTVLRRN